MARTITVTDDDSGVVTTVVVAKDEQGFSLVKEIKFTASNGNGLERLDLSVLRDFGLTDRAPTLPAPVQVPAPEPAGAVAEPAPRRRAGKAAGRKKAATKPVSGSGRGYRRAPDVETLQRLFAEHGGPSAVARALGVPAHTVAGWLRRFRAEGHEFATAAA